MIINQYFSERLLENETLVEVDWQSQRLELGLVLSLSAQGKIEARVLEKILFDARLEHSVRVFVAVQLLKVFGKDLEKLRKNDEWDEVLVKFAEIGDAVCGLKVGVLGEELKKWFRKVFEDCLSKGKLSRKFAVIGVQAWKNKDFVGENCSLMNFSQDELEKLTQVEKIGQYEALSILDKGCQVVLNKRLKPSDSLSILTYNTLVQVLKISVFKEAELKFIQQSLEKYSGNFTAKQKEVLDSRYNRLLKKSRSQNNSTKDQLLAAPARSDEKSPENLVKPQQLKSSTLEFTSEPGLSLSEQFDTLYFNLKDQILSNKKVQLQTLNSQLLHMYEQSSSELYSLLIYWSTNECPCKFSSLLWRLISKSIHALSLFSQSQRNNIHANIDSIVFSSNKSHL